MVETPLNNEIPNKFSLAVGDEIELAGVRIRFENIQRKGGGARLFVFGVGENTLSFHFSEGQAVQSSIKVGENVFLFSQNGDLNAVELTQPKTPNAVQRFFRRVLSRLFS